MIFAAFIYFLGCTPFIFWLIRGAFEFRKGNMNTCVYFFKALIYSSGLTIMGYAILDDILLFILYLSILNLQIKKSLHITEQKPIYSLIYAILTIFLMLNSIRTTIITEDFRAIRFPILFLLLFLLSNNKKFKHFISENSSINQIVNLIIKPVAYLFSLYILSEGILYWIGFEKFQFQNIFWPSTSTMFSILIFIFPLIGFLCSRSIYFHLNKKNRKILIYLIFIGALGSFFYDSRLGQLFSLSVLLLVFLSNNKIGITFFIFTLIFIVISYNGNIAHFLDTLFISATGRQESDLDRIIQPLAAYISITENDSILVNLFGYGYYAERKFVGDYLNIIYLEYLKRGFHGDIIRMPSAAAFLAGNGIIGGLLLCLTLVTYSISILSLKIQLYWKVATITLMNFLYVLSYFTSINYELVLFYLILSPALVWLMLTRSMTRKNK